MTARWRGYTAEQRFWMRVQKSDGCWLWTGRLNDYGYGRIRFDQEPNEIRGRSVRAHRLSWALVNGPIPDGMDVLHTCDNPPCVRPDHLYLGTPVENGRDVRERKRQPNARLTHCKRGHPFEGGNLIVRSDGARRCRACHNLRRSRTVDYRSTEVI